MTPSQSSVGGHQMANHSSDSSNSLNCSFAAAALNTLSAAADASGGEIRRSTVSRKNKAGYTA